MELKVDPNRMNGATGGTGIFIRASLNGKFDTYDIDQLDSESLLTWLRSRGGNNPWAENVVGILLGHEHLVKE